jgi:collagen type VII alpha
MPVTVSDGVSATLVQPAIYRGTVTPTSGAIGDLWEDTSTGPPVLKQCTSISPLTWDPISAGGAGTITVQEEGVTQSATVTTLNFTGAGVTASGGGAIATIDVPASGSTVNTVNYILAGTGEDGDDGRPGIQGQTGATGNTGASGADGLQGLRGLDGADGEDGPMGPPGIAGSAGATGPAGADGVQGYIGRTGDDGDDGAIGPPGLAGSTGPTGPAGNDGYLIIRGNDGEQGEEGPMGPPGPTGPTGPAGGGAGGAFTAFTKDLGVAERAGTFDITGLSGLTANKVVSIVQTMAQIASKGNARDEYEMDPITLTGYVVDAATIRALWACAGGRNVAVGTYEFAYQVSG